MERLQYHPLADNEIRVLQFLPSERLACRLIHVNLDNPPSYSALSYTWGEPLFSRVIIVNDQILPITENLYNALSYVENLLRGSEQSLWVDTICINQDNLQERSIQVRLMKPIYEGAATIGAWLDKRGDKTDSELAVKKMLELNSLLKIHQNRHDGDVYLAYESIFRENKAIFDASDTTECYRAWLGIQSIMKNPWWRRTWIYQEATVPEQEASKTWFFCGAQPVSWAHMAAAISMSIHLNTIPQLRNSLLYDIAYGSAKALLSFSLTREKNDSLEMKFLNLLHIFRETDCTDPRDKVYAPLNLATDNPVAKIVPDYSKPVEEVYADVVKLSLVQPGHELDFLGYVIRSSDEFFSTENSHEQFDIVRSWAPDWREHISIAPFLKIMNLQDPTSGETLHTAVYKAGGSLPVDAVINDRYLDIRGCHVDTIQQLSDIWNDGYNPSTIRDWRPQNAPAKYCTGAESLDSALLRTTVVDIKRDAEEAVSGRGNRMDWTLFDVPDDDLTGAQIDLKNQMHLAANSACYGRRLAWTREGYVGVVPAAAAMGDEVVCFFGGQMLYVLRRSVEGETWEFMGECYIHGLMDGEVIDCLEKKSTFAETFKLL